MTLWKYETALLSVWVLARSRTRALKIVRQNIPLRFLKEEYKIDSWGNGFLKQRVMRIEYKQESY